MRNLRRAATSFLSRICRPRISPRFSSMTSSVRPRLRFSSRIAGTSVSATLASSSSVCTAAYNFDHSGSPSRTSFNIPHMPIRKSANDSVRFDSSGNRTTTTFAPSASSDRTASSMHESRWVLPIPRGPMNSRWFFDFLPAEPRRDSMALSSRCRRATLVWRRRSALVTPDRYRPIFEWRAGSGIVFSPPRFQHAAGEVVEPLRDLDDVEIVLQVEQQLVEYLPAFMRRECDVEICQ